jgi:hypothetical protein
MSEYNEQPVYELEGKEQLDIPDQDDRYPGSFFKIPGAPITGNTTWSIS